MITTTICTLYRRIFCRRARARFRFRTDRFRSVRSRAVQSPELKSRRVQWTIRLTTARWCRTAAASDCSQTVVTVNKSVHGIVTTYKRQTSAIDERKCDFLIPSLRYDKVYFRSGPLQSNMDFGVSARVKLGLFTGAEAIL